MIKYFFSRNRILILAIMVSLTWHAMWLSVIKVVAPDARSRIKFSKVAFLGPILDRGVMEVRMSPRERSFLENRYLSLMQNSSPFMDHASGEKLRKERPDQSFDDKMVYLVDEAVSGKKIEPSSEM